MENFEASNSAAHHAEGEHTFDTKAIWRTFWILLGITCLELVIGMFVAPHFPHHYKIWFNILYIIFTAAKAFYIIAEFMHLRHEVKNLIMTIAIPALLFVWFIGAFLWEGSSFRHLRNTLAPHDAKLMEKSAPHHAPEHAPEGQHEVHPEKVN